MLRFYQDHASKQWVIVGELDVWRAVCGEDHVCHFPESGLVEDYAKAYRELTPADFLRETRGTAIADKALCLLAAERGVRCWSRGYNWWVCGAGKRLCLPGMSIYDIEHPDDDPNHGCAKSDLATILASEPGKKHREQIEAFILGLPVAKDEPKERTLLDVVRDVTDAGMCGRYQHALSSHTGTLAGFEQFFVTHVDDEADADNWISTYLNVDRGNYSTVRYYKLAIARRLGLVADEPEAESVRPRVRCFEMGDVYWIAIDYGNGFVGYGCGGNDRTMALQCEWPTTAFDNITEVTIEHVRQKYAGQDGIAKLDELLRETGEYVDPEAERGDYVIARDGYTCDKILTGVTLEYARRQAREVADDCAAKGEAIAVVLRPLGPAIITLRPVEKTTWEVEEVKS